MVDLCLLGCGGMMPLPNRWLSSLLYRYNGRMILVDCGEGTQIPLKECGWGFKSIDAIFFTHYHADHIAGLPGLLLTIGNSGRTKPLSLFGPIGLEKVVAGLSVISPKLPFALLINELPNDSEAAFCVGNVRCSSIPVDHNIPCLSYSMRIDRLGRFNKNKAVELDIPITFWKRLQNGETVTIKDKVVTPEMVLGKARRGIKVGYCSDTRPIESLNSFMSGCDILICEGNYGDSALAQKAYEKGHMVFSQAAQIARKSESRELWLTHFSPAIENPEDYLKYASDIFENTVVGKDLMKKTINFE